jgi:hypothetical protein
VSFTVSNRQKLVTDALGTWADAIATDNYDAVGDAPLLEALREINSAIAAQARRRKWKGLGK